MERTADRLREARRQAGYGSADEFAQRAAIEPTIYRGYEDGTRYLSPQLGNRLAALLGVDWVDLLYGHEYVDTAGDYGWQGYGPRRRPRGEPRESAYVGAAATTIPRLAPAIAVQRATPYVAEQPARSALAEAPPPAANREPRRAAATEAPEDMVVDELDPRLAGGAGLARASEHPVHSWRIPRDLVRTASRAGAANLKLMAILSDDMEPSFRLSDRVLIDTSDTRPSPPGVFLVWDGMSLILRRVEVVPGTDAAILRIAADNPKYQPVERRVAETMIQGRVLGKWSWV